ncbi:hypothetical protein V8D89_010073 [Ganoderma adspersum]
MADQRSAGERGNIRVTTLCHLRMCFRPRQGVWTGVRARGRNDTVDQECTHQTPSGCPELAMWRLVAVLWLSKSRPGSFDDLRMRRPSCFYLERELQVTRVAAECLTVLNQASLCPSPVRAIIFGGAYEARGAASTPSGLYLVDTQGPPWMSYRHISGAIRVWPYRRLAGPLFLHLSCAHLASPRGSTLDDRVLIRAGRRQRCLRSFGRTPYNPVFSIAATFPICSFSSAHTAEA